MRRLKARVTIYRCVQLQYLLLPYLITSAIPQFQTLITKFHKRKVLSIIFIILVCALGTTILDKQFFSYQCLRARGGHERDQGANTIHIVTDLPELSGWLEDFLHIRSEGIQDLVVSEDMTEV